MTLAITEYLRNHSLQKLQDEYDIRVNRHKKYANLVCLGYNQITSPMDRDFVRQCRGIILDEKNNWRVVSFAFERFFNYGEPNAIDVDFRNARIYEKLDGSLMQLYHYDGKWNVATSGTADASGEVNGYNKSFHDIFWRVWKEHGYTLPKDTHKCYAFELMTPYNIIVVRHNNSSIVLHGSRDLNTLEELDPVVEAKNNNWKCVSVFDFNSFDDITFCLGEMNGSEKEGFVVCDNKFRRVKMKCGDYVKKHRIVSGVSSRNLLDIIRKNESDEFLVYCPQFRSMHDEIKSKYDNLCKDIYAYYKSIKHIDNRKEFASLACSQKFSGVLFDIKFGGREKVEDCLENMRIKTLERLLG